MFSRLGALAFMSKKENTILTEASAVGKSFLAQALGHQACMLGKRVLYTNTARLFTWLKLSKVDGTFLKELEKLRKTDLLSVMILAYKPLIIMQSKL